MSEKRIKITTTTVRQADDATREIVHLISARTVDRDGDLVEPRGGRLSNFRKNPVVLFSHDPTRPIGRNVAISASEEEVVATTRFAGLDQANEDAEMVYRLYRDGFMRAFSIGFMPITVSFDKPLPNMTGVWFKEWELMEYSAVAVPSNPDALVRMVKAYGLPDGAREKDLLEAVERDRKPFFDVAAAFSRARFTPPADADISTTIAEGMRQLLGHGPSAAEMEFQIFRAARAAVRRACHGEEFPAFDVATAAARVAERVVAAFSTKGGRG